MDLWGGRATGGGTVVVSNPGEATQTASLREAGLLGPAWDAELDRWVSAVCRNTDSCSGDRGDTCRVIKGGLRGRAGPFWVRVRP
jgi:hypothetical protein